MRKVQQQLPRPCSRRALLRPWPPPPAPLALPAALAPRSKERPGSRFRRICLSSEVNRRKMVDPLGRVSSWKTTRRRAFRSWFSFVRLRRVCAWKRGVWSLEDCVGRTSARAPRDLQRPERTHAMARVPRSRHGRMPRRIGSKGMGTCSRTPLNIVYSSWALASSVFRLPAFPPRVPRTVRPPALPSASSDVARDRAARSASGVTIPFGRDCTDPTPRSLATYHRATAAS